MGMFTDYCRKKDAEALKAEKEAKVEQRRMYASERDRYVSMRVAFEILRNLQTEFKARYDMAGVADVMTKTVAEVEDAMKRIYYTIPDDQRQTIVNNIENATYATGVKTPGSVGVRSGDSKWGLYVAYSDMKVLVESLADHCLICTGSAQEQEACELRKVYDRVGFDVEHPYGECGYRQLI